MIYHTRVFFTILLIFSSNLYLFSEITFDVYDYNNAIVEPIEFNPVEGVYHNSLFVDIKSDYGNIYYFVESDMGKSEPVKYDRQLFLRGEKGAVKDYTIMVVLEKIDGRVELFKKKYRIDMLHKLEYKSENQYIEDVKVDRVTSEDEIEIKSRYAYVKNTLYDTGRKVTIPPEFNDAFTGKSISREIKINGSKGESYETLVVNAYEKNGIIYSNYEYFSIDNTVPSPPSFGSVYWGKKYKQNYTIEIKPEREEDSVFYWLRDWEKENLIFGPPDVDINDTAWQKYTGSIELNSHYGKEGVLGLAAFSLRENGNYSEISGPFYVKAYDIENGDVQVFDSVKESSENVKRHITVNDRKIENEMIFTSKAVLNFEGFNKDDFFYFNYDNENAVGKSDLIHCSGKYIFELKNNDFTKVNLFYSNGESIGYFYLSDSSFVLPRLKQYNSNIVEVNTDEVFDFIMPLGYEVRYEMAVDFEKYLNVTESSSVFTGKVRVKADDNEKSTLKIKFASFDKDGGFIDESDTYYFTVDKEKPFGEVMAEGVDFSVYHNQTQSLKLIPPEEKGQIYVRMSNDDEWSLYTEPIVLKAPDMGVYIAKVYTKFVDLSGNERENSEPFIIGFDRRAVFVDSTKSFSGNGSELSPVNSLQRAIEYAHENDIKIVYLLSASNDMVKSIEITSDIIIQPYLTNLRPSVIMDSKSFWQKTHNWFTVKDKGFLEIRNLDINVKSGKSLLSIEDAKVKMYNNNILFSNNNDFTFFSNIKGQLGVRNSSFDVINKPENFQFLSSNDGVNDLRGVKLKSSAVKYGFFDCSNKSVLRLKDASLNLSSDESSYFVKSNDTSIIFDDVEVEHQGDNLDEDLLTIDKSEFELSKFRYHYDNKTSGDNAKFIQVSSSEGTMKFIDLKFSNTTSLIALNLQNSNVSISQLMTDISNVYDYAYLVRVQRSSVKLFSSILRVSKGEGSAVGILLNNSIFDGSQNSLFFNNNKTKSFFFWINDKAVLNSVNSIFYTDNQSSTDKFVYINSKTFDNFRPNWISNIVSKNTEFVENLIEEGLTYIREDFEEKNVFYDLSGIFNMERDLFFVPVITSIINQGGVDRDKTDILIPEKDYFNRNRILQGYGIDIGAVQVTGNTE